jgi:hypothetical protein
MHLLHAGFDVNRFAVGLNPTRGFRTGSKVAEAR